MFIGDDKKNNTGLIMSEIEILKTKVRNLESNKFGLGGINVIPLHIHNGLDSPQVRVGDLDSILYQEATFNPGSLADGTGTTIRVTVTGAQFGDFTLFSYPGSLAEMTVTSYVGTNDAVDVRVQNESGLTFDLPVGTCRVLVIKKLF